MTKALNPQAKEMADESMVRNLAAQADAIWPQEQRFFDRYQLGVEAQILDAGCGTGEISARLAAMFPRAAILGIDLVDDHLARAGEKCAAAGSRVRFETEGSSKPGCQTERSTSWSVAMYCRRFRTPIGPSRNSSA